MLTVLVLLVVSVLGTLAGNENVTYVWLPARNGELPSFPPISGGLTYDSRMPYVLARADLDGHLLPCTISLDRVKAKCHVDGIIYDVEDYQVAIGMGLAWSPFFADTKLDLPPTSIAVGHFKTGEPLYACRTIQENQFESIGYLDPTNRYCKAVISTYVRANPHYEVLVEVNATVTLP